MLWKRVGLWISSILRVLEISGECVWEIGD